MARLMSGLLLVLHLLISQNEVMLQVEGAVCSAKSKLFNGVCINDSNCARICEKEGFLYGHCKGILMRCLCYKDCKGAARPPHKPPLSPPPPPPPPPCGCPATPPPPPPGTPPCKPPATPPPPCVCHNPPPPPTPHTPKIGPPCGYPTPPVK